MYNAAWRKESRKASTEMDIVMELIVLTIKTTIMSFSGKEGVRLLA